MTLFLLSLRCSWPMAGGGPASLWQSKRIDSSERPCPSPLDVCTLARCRQISQIFEPRVVRCTAMRGSWDPLESLRTNYRGALSCPPSLLFFSLFFSHFFFASVMCPPFSLHVCYFACLPACLRLGLRWLRVQCACVCVCTSLFRSLLWNKLHSGWGAKWLISGTQIKIQLLQFEATQEWYGKLTTTVSALLSAPGIPVRCWSFN